jgi:hypothetical protein
VSARATRAAKDRAEKIRRFRTSYVDWPAAS